MAEPTERDRARVREWWAAQSVVENPEFFHQDRDEAIVEACAHVVADERARVVEWLRAQTRISPIAGLMFADALEADHE